MEDKILLRAIGDFEIYQFLSNINEFVEFYNANLDNFDIFEIATLKDVEITQINSDYTLYDMTLSQTDSHFWLIKDEESGTYEPVDSKEEADHVVATLQQAN